MKGKKENTKQILEPLGNAETTKRKKESKNTSDEAIVPSVRGSIPKLSKPVRKKANNQAIKIARKQETRTYFIPIFRQCL